MKRLLRVGVLLSLIVNFWACTGEEDEQDGFQFSRDLLQEIRSTLQEETTLIDFRKNHQPTKYLLRGWGFPEEHFTWALSENSSLRFYSYSIDSPLEIQMVCQAAQSTNGTQQQTELVLNGRPVAALTISPHAFESYNVSLPPEALRSGQNILEFRFAYATRPVDLDPQAESTQSFVAAFKRILFRQNNHLSAGFAEETAVIDFRSEGQPEQSLLDGWETPEADHTWAITRTPGLQFYRRDLMHDVELDVRCQSIPSVDTQESQRAIVRLNGEQVAELTIASEQAQTYSFSLPKSLLRLGRNIIRFEFSYQATPAEIWTNSQDGRELSVAFQKITFSPASVQKQSHEGLLQRADSTMSRLLSLPERFRLEVRHQRFEKAVSHIEFVSEQHDVTSIKLSSGKAFRKIVSLTTAGLYRMRLISSGPAQSYTQWNEIRLFTEDASENDSQADVAFSKAATPDILLYVVDTLRADHVGCYGYERDTTPDLDRFAEGNAIFRNAYSAASWTKPGGATILTGLLAKHHKTMEPDDRLPADLLTLPELLQTAGYYTAAFGANKNISREFGFDQGFGLFEECPLDFKSVSVFCQADSLNEDVFRFLENYVKRKDRKPLFLMVWTVDPHDPYTPPDSVTQMFDIEKHEPIDTYFHQLLQRIQEKEISPTASQIEYMKSRYDQEIYANDRAFGAFLDKLKSLSMYEESVIMFTSDHGEEFFEHGGFGHGRTLYNDQIRIPFIIKAPGVSTGEHKERFQLSDIYPSILDLIGLDVPYALDGRSLLREPELTRTLYFEERANHNELTAVLDERKKLIYNSRINKELSDEHLPFFELYALEDWQERDRLDLQDWDDDFRVQQLLEYLQQENSFGLATKVELPPELEQKLRDLGYVR